MNLMTLFKTLGFISILSFLGLPSNPTFSLSNLNSEIARLNWGLREWDYQLIKYVAKNAERINSYGLRTARELSKGHDVTWDSAQTTMTKRLLTITMRGRLDLTDPLPTCGITLKLIFLGEKSYSEKYPFYFEADRPSVKVYDCGWVGFWEGNVEDDARREVNAAIKNERQIVIETVNRTMRRIMDEIRAREDR